MGTTATVGDLTAVLSQQRECFAAFVAAGISYSSAAERVGLSRDYGWDLMQLPAIRQRVIDLAAQPVELIRSGIEAELLMIRNRCATSDLDAEARANVELRLKLLMSHARLRGWIVDKKQVQRTSIEVSPHELNAHLAQFLDALEPGARRDIEARAKAATSRRRPKAKVIDAAQSRETPDTGE